MITLENIRAEVQKNKEEIINCLVELVQCESVTGNEEPVSKIFKKYMEEMGIAVKTYEAMPHRPNLFGEWFGKEKGKRFIFNGHMDVFPPIASDKGLYGPFSGKVIDGKIYGRGTGDMKGGDAAALMAVKILKKLNFEPKGSILLSWMCDEENGSKLGSKWLVKQELLNGDYGICMEPTDGEILTYHGGIYRAFYKYTAKAMHSHAPHPTGSALEKAWLAAGELMELGKEINKIENPYFDNPSLSVTTFHSGTATNLHASEALISVDRRYIAGESIESVQKEISDVLDALKEKYPQMGMDYTVEVQSDRPILLIDENCEMVREMSKVWEEVFEKPVKYRYCQGGTDAATIVKHNGMQMIVCGPTDGLSNTGTADENITIDQLLNMVELYALTVVRLMS